MSHRLQVLIPEELNARIAEAAQRKRLSKGEWVRRAVRDSLRAGGNGGEATDPVSRMAALNGPTADIDQMLAEIEAGRREESLR
jgi:hypothetical protein